MGNIYFGVNSVARKVKKAYFGVNNVARKIKKVYIGINNVARLVWQDDISVIVATRGDGHILRSIDKGENWTDFLITTGTSSGSVTASGIDGIIYDDAFYTAYLIDLTNWEVRYAYSEDGSGAYTYKIVSSTSSNTNGKPVGIAKNGNNIVIPCNFRTLFRSTDNGNTWSKLSDIPFQPYSIASNGAIMIIGSATGNNIYRSTNSGASWTSIKVSSETYDTAQVDFAKNNFYMTCTNDDGKHRKYYSTDNGVTWISLASGSSADSFPQCSRYCNNKYYMGTSGYSCYYSTDGKSFTRMSTTDLSGLYNSSNSPMYTGTHYAMVNYEGKSSSTSTKYSWFASIVNVTDSEWTFRKMVGRTSDARATSMTYSQPDGTL